MHRFERTHPAHPDPTLLFTVCYPDHLKLVTRFAYGLLDQAPDLLLRRVGLSATPRDPLTREVFADYAIFSVLGPLHCRDLPDPDIIAPEVCRLEGVRIREPNTLKALRSVDRIAPRRDGLSWRNELRRCVAQINGAFVETARALLSFTATPDGQYLFSNAPHGPPTTPIKQFAHILTHWPELNELGHDGLISALYCADRMAVLLDALIYNQSGCADSLALREVTAGLRGRRPADPKRVATWQAALPQLLRDLYREFLAITDTGGRRSASVELASLRVLLKALRTHKLLIFHRYRPVNPLFRVMQEATLPARK